MAALGLVLAGPSMAVTCTSTTNWYSLGPPGLEVFGQSFGSVGSYTDCYSFSLSSAADSFGGTWSIDPWLNQLDLTVGSVTLFSGGLANNQTTGGFITADSTPGSFSFTSLSAGTYTLAVASKVTSDWGFTNDRVGYIGVIATTGASVASAAPEPESYAMMLAGLAGVGFAVRRRRRA